MAYQDATDLLLQKAHAHAFGDVASMTKSISLSAATVADVFRFIRLPANSEIIDSIMTVKDASNASVTLTLGYDHVDGTSGDDTAFFNAAKSLASVAVFRADTGKGSVIVDREVDIVGVLAGANITAATVVEVTVFYKYKGGL